MPGKHVWGTCSKYDKQLYNRKRALGLGPDLHQTLGLTLGLNRGSGATQPVTGTEGLVQPAPKLWALLNLDITWGLNILQDILWFIPDLKVYLSMLSLWVFYFTCDLLQCFTHWVQSKCAISWWRFVTQYASPRGIYVSVLPSERKLWMRYIIQDYDFLWIEKYIHNVGRWNILPCGCFLSILEQLVKQKRKSYYVGTIVGRKSFLNSKMIDKLSLSMKLWHLQV